LARIIPWFHDLDALELKLYKNLSKLMHHSCAC
jgi:hypothetical protein